jgi:hypothetical protein
MQVGVMNFGSFVFSPFGRFTSFSTFFFLASHPFPPINQNFPKTPYLVYGILRTAAWLWPAARQAWKKRFLEIAISSAQSGRHFHGDDRDID